MSQIKLLLVDDEEDYVRTMAARLALREVDSRVALSGEAALTAVASDTPDVMVLDLRMPGIPGLEVLERVKREYPHVQVVVLTGHGSAEAEREARRLGAFDYLEKPADTQQLLSVIRSAWQRALEVLRESRQAFSRSMEAAAMAEAGVLEYVQERPGAPVAAPSRPAPAGGCRVLFVDDEEDFVRTLAERMRLRELGGEVALSGSEALELLERDAPDVMVLDLRMPGMDGMEVLRRARRLYPQVAVVILTGHGSEQEEEEARRLGAFDYLCKPVELSLLIETVRKAASARLAAGTGG